VYYFLPLGGQKYFHKRPIGSFRGSIDLSLINSKMLRIKGCLLDGRILSIDGLWVKLLFMWISIFSRPHVVEIAWLSTTWGLLKMKTHIKRSVTHKPSLILTKFDLLGDYHQEGETRNFLHVFSVALILKMIFDQLFCYYC